MSTVLGVDDKEMMRDSVGTTLQRAGFSVITADGGEAALAAIAARRPDAVANTAALGATTVACRWTRYWSAESTSALNGVAAVVASETNTSVSASPRRSAIGSIRRR